MGGGGDCSPNPRLSLHEGRDHDAVDSVGAYRDRKSNNVSENRVTQRQRKPSLVHVQFQELARRGGRCCPGLEFLCASVGLDQFIPAVLTFQNHLNELADGAATANGLGGVFGCRFDFGHRVCHRDA